MSKDKKRLRTPVAAVLAASLTAAALARAARSEPAVELARIAQLPALASIALEIAGDALLAGIAARSAEERERLAPGLAPATGRLYARAVESALRRIDARRAPLWEKNRRAFDERLDAAAAALARSARPLRGAKLAFPDERWHDFARAYGFEVGEPREARAVLVDSARRAAELSGVCIVRVPRDVGDEGTRDLVSFHETVVGRILLALKPSA